MEKSKYTNKIFQIQNINKKHNEMITALTKIIKMKTENIEIKSNSKY